MNREIKIRQAFPEDAPKIAEVHIKSLRQAYKGIVHQSYLDSGLNVRERAERWQGNLDTNRKGTFLAFNGAALIGFASVGKSRHKKHPDYAELYAIYLDPDHFGKGVGRALFQRAVEHAIELGLKKMYVSVLIGNKIGRDFYERMGAFLIENSEEELTIGGQPYIETKYEWKELKV